MKVLRKASLCEKLFENWDKVEPVCGASRLAFLPSNTLRVSTKGAKFQGRSSKILPSTVSVCL